MELNDYIVVGSGCCGAIAAKTLTDKGLKVLMLDAGILPSQKLESKFENFSDIRQNEENQTVYFLGNHFDSIGNIQKKNPIHLTPNRQFVTDMVEKYLVWKGNDFNPIESLAKGGLGNAWGLGSYVYSDKELEETGLSVAESQKAYKWLSSFIAISGGNDHSAPYANNNLFQPQKSIPLDFNGERLWRNLEKKKEKLKSLGFIIGRTPLAVSTDNEMNGEKYTEDDLDFYSIGKSSAFRPFNLVENLEKGGLLNYKRNQLVLSFTESEDYITVETLDISTNEKKAFTCKKLILATGALSTGRIVMRSMNVNKLPILCNPYTYIPSIQIPLIGNENINYQTGLAQISMYYDIEQNHKRIAMGSTYSYRSLMGFRLLREFPLDMKGGIKFLKLVQPALNITGVFHPEYGSDKKFIERVSDDHSITGDALRSTYLLSDEELKVIHATEDKFKKALKSLGTIPLKVVQNKHGASIHYGGTLPFAEKEQQSPSINKNGHLNGFKNVFVADGSGFKFLSGKGLTLTLMAYSHIVASNTVEK